MFEIDELTYWFIPMIIIYSVFVYSDGYEMDRDELGVRLLGRILGIISLLEVVYQYLLLIGRKREREQKTIIMSLIIDDVWNGIQHQQLMKIYLLISCLLLAAYSHSCQQIGSSDMAELSSCVVSSPAPQLKWSMNITLLKDYNWRGADEMKYFYLTAKDEVIDETCYQGQTIKGQYAKGTTLLIEQLCFNFKPSISKGDKLYLMVFWDAGASKQIIYLTFSANGGIQSTGVPTEEEKNKINRFVEKQLVSE